MAPKLLHDRSTDGPLKLVALMSGSGTNLRRLLELERRLAAEPSLPPFEVVVIFSDNAKSSALEIGAEYDIPTVVHDISAFYRRRSKPRRDLELRREFDEQTVAMLAPFGARAAAYAGYMSIVTPPIIEAYLGINVHPADLSVEENGRRKWTGDFAVRDAIVAGEQFIYSTTHLVELEVDGGPLLMISEPVPVEIPEGADLCDSKAAADISRQNQERLKEKGDWVVFPQTILEIAEGKYAVDSGGMLYYEGRPIPGGRRLTGK